MEPLTPDEPPPKRRRAHRRTKPLEAPAPPPPCPEPPRAPSPPPEPEFPPDVPGIEVCLLPGGGEEQEPLPEFAEIIEETPALPGEWASAPLAFAPAPDDPRRRDLLAKIRRYRANFVALRAHPQLPDDASVELLERTVERFRETVSTKSTSRLAKAAYLTSVKALEMITSKVGLKTYGTADLLGKSEQVDTLLLVLVSEHGLGDAMPPAHQLAFVTASSMLGVHCLNARAEALREYTSKPADPGLSAEFASLEQNEHQYGPSHIKHHLGAFEETKRAPDRAGRGTE